MVCQGQSENIYVQYKYKTTQQTFLESSEKELRLSFVDLILASQFKHLKTKKKTHENICSYSWEGVRSKTTCRDKAVASSRQTLLESNLFMLQTQCKRSE